jgi:Ca2+-binding EF-hand superfamily protein
MSLHYLLDASSFNYSGDLMNKLITTLIATFCLSTISQAVLACEPVGHMVDHHFDDVDTNHDGAISKAEADAYHNKHFKQLDANSDGKITREELTATGMKCHEKSQTKFKDRFYQRFDEIDINHDGMLSKDETEIGMPMVFKHFDEVDANHDGKISKEEIKAMMDKHHGQYHDGSQDEQPEAIKPETAKPVKE